MKYSDEINLSSIELDELDKIFGRLKRRRPKNLDNVFHEAHDKAFNKIDCLECANCCKTTSPIFRDIDVQRIAKKFKQSTRDFENAYLKRDEDDDLVLKSSPCTFLDPDNHCSIYDVRPLACKEYPHTNRKKMFQVLDLTRKNAEICPAVSLISKDVIVKYT